MRATCTPVLRSKGQRSGSSGPLMLTHIVLHIFRMARPPNFKPGIRTEDDDLHEPQAPRPPRSGSQSHVISIIVSPKLARVYPMTRATWCTSFKVKRLKVSTGRLTQTYKMCHIFRTLRPKNFKVGVRMEDVHSHRRQAPWPTNTPWT